MSSREQLKSNIYWLLETIENDEVLQAVEILLSQQIPPASFGLRDHIAQALREADAGQGRPHEAVWPELCAQFRIKQ